MKRIRVSQTVKFGLSVSALTICGFALLFGGFGVVFLVERPGPLGAALGGALMGIGVVCFGWLAYMIRGGV